MANTQELATTLKTVIKELFPELSGYNFPLKARVIKVNEAGGAVNAMRKVYSVDVQPLKPDGSDDEKNPAIPDVEIPVLWAASQRGFFCLPEVGAVVRIAYYYNDPAYPYVDAVLAEGYDVPQHALGSLIIQQKDGVRIEIDKESNMHIKTPEKVIFVEGNHPVAFADIVKSVFDGHTHPTPHGESGAPSQQMRGHDSKQVFTG